MRNQVEVDNNILEMCMKFQKNEHNYLKHSFLLLSFTLNKNNIYISLIKHLWHMADGRKNLSGDYGFVLLCILSCIYKITSFFHSIFTYILANKTKKRQNRQIKIEA